MLEIIEMKPAHWTAVKRIYLESIATGQATFQTTVPDWEEWDRSHLASCRLVAIENNDILAWAALTPVSGRCVYAGVAEVSVYVAANARGKGVGQAILEALVKESEKNNFWTLQAGIFPENSASLKLHQNAGFRIVGTRERIGQMNGKWQDTVLLERRSTLIGI